MRSIDSQDLPGISSGLTVQNRRSNRLNRKVLWSSAVLLVSLSTIGFSLAGDCLASATIQPGHAVTFHENDTAADQVITSETNNVAAPLTLFRNLSPAFVDPGYTFSNWNTSAYGNGISYSDGAVYNFASGPIDLFAQWTENSVTFYQNRNGSDSTSVVEYGNNVEALTLFTSLAPAFSNTGYTFAGWSTLANGTGTSYANGATYDFRIGDLSLYAQWSPAPTETANFSPSGASGTVQPLSGSQGSQVTLPSGSGLSNPGYTFGGWNTAADGSGTEYSSGAVITLTSDLTLYAQWVPDVYTVTYSPGSGSVTPASARYTVGTSGLTLPTPTDTGYTFSGWFTASSGGTLVGLAGSSFSPTQDTTLYAQWTADTYTVTYDPGAGTVSPSQSTFSTGGTALSLPTPSDGLSTFLGWFTAPSGGTLVGLAGATFTPTQNVTLYAQWQAPVMYTVTFDPNGGTGSIAPITAPAGSTITIPGVSGLLRPGYTLATWSTAKTGTGSTYTSGSTMTVTSSVTLYAVWSGKPPAVLLGAVGPFAGRTTKLTAAMKSQIARLAAKVKARKCSAVTIYGYAPSVGLASLSTSISRARASAVASYLRQRLAALHVRATIKSAGEGFVPGGGSANARVEVLGQ
jgi:uncharacterized repeat protein (TIGR02543 family)